MDVSETYVKMCEKATEIQRLWQQHNGDYCCVPGGVVVVYYVDVDYDSGYPLIWLPRQDQLQEMIDGNLAEKHFAFCDFIAQLSVSPPDFSSLERFKSFEQLWLAFVMKEKYNKTWNGEDWE